MTDADKNLAAIAETVRNSPTCLRIDHLPYNRTAGGKYASCGMEFSANLRRIARYFFTGGVLHIGRWR